ncbi:MAG TPA: TIGR00180 family glycosyltransferase [Candidatus Limnocylindria bacterium]|jgi:glycosyltransferase domain-containing protein|nr:TIGR00180 family glycosyltransferase [Candidatus Limnocylindria bacterium]
MNVEPAAQLTLVVPTFQRSRFLDRLLDYSEAVQLSFPILVVDSSEVADFGRNATRIAACRPPMRVKHLRFDCGLMEKMLHGVEKVATPYCAFWADDDFQLPEGLQACLRFLDENPDHASCMGQFVAVRRHEKHTEVDLETYPSREDASAADRILRWSENFYSNFYAVYRTSVLLEMLRLVATASCYERCRMIPEVLMGQTALLLGRQRMLGIPSIVYQMHDGNDSRLIPCIRDDVSFPEDYRRYREAAAPMFAAAAGFSLAEADSLVDLSFRNIHRWTGGRWWLFKKLHKNIRRPWRRMYLRWDARRAVPQIARVIKQRIPETDDRLRAGSIAIALAAVARHPNGKPQV